MKARPRDNPIAQMIRSEAENVIREANLGVEDTRIAQMYLIDRMPQLDIAMEMMLDRKTVGTRLKQIEKRLRLTTGKLSS